MSISIFGLRSSGIAFKSAIGLIITIIVMTTLITNFREADLAITQLVLMLIFFSMQIKLAIQQVLFSSDKITGNSLAGSICIFLLLGIIWLLLYSITIELMPNSFSGLPQDTWPGNFSGIIYYSFVTLTTLGFGDILPLSPTARFLTYMEAIVGVFYMAIFVSSLVGAAMQRKS